MIEGLLFMLWSLPSAKFMNNTEYSQKYLLKWTVLSLIQKIDNTKEIYDQLQSPTGDPKLLLKRNYICVKTYKNERL